MRNAYLERQSTNYLRRAYMVAKREMRKHPPGSHARATWIWRITTYLDIIEERKKRGFHAPLNEK